MGGQASAPEDPVRSYWEQRAPSYDSSVWHTCCPGVWRRLLEQVLPRGSRALDIGAGTGFIASILASMDYGLVVGVDVSRSMLSIAKRKLAWAGHVVDLVEADAAALPLRNSAVDVAVARHVLWTLTRPAEALREAARCTRCVAVFTFSTRSREPQGWRGPRTPLRWVRGPDEVLGFARSAGVEASVEDASWVRRMQERLTGRRVEGETGYYVLRVRGRGGNCYL